MSQVPVPRRPEPTACAPGGALAGHEPKRPALTRSVGRGRDLLARVQARVEALAALDHPGVLVPQHAHLGPVGDVVVSLPQVPGKDLASIATARAPLGVEETVWLGQRVGAALEAMHAAGLAHGDLSPANVIVDHGRVTLVDTIAGCLEDELGTVGFRAPERRAGATLPADVCSLGLLLRWCAAPEAVTRIEAWTAPMVVAQPTARPPMQVAVHALEGCAAARPISVPVDDDVVVASRARAAVRTERIALGRWWRLRQRAVRVAGGIAVALCAGAVLVAVPQAVDAALESDISTRTSVRVEPAPDAGALSRASDGPGAVPQLPARTSQRASDAESVADDAAQASAKEGSTTVTDGAVHDIERPGDAAAAITERRGALLRAGDAAGLRALGAGAAGKQLSALADAIDAGDLAYDGVTIDVLDVSVVNSGREEATVDVAYAVSAHDEVTASGVRQVDGYQEQARLTLEWDGRWRVTVVAATPS